MGRGGTGRKGTVAAVLIPVAIALTGVLSPLPAGSSTPLAPTHVRFQSLDTPADEARLLAQVEASLKRKNELDTRVGELDRQVSGAQSELRNAQNRLLALQVRERRAEVQLDEVRQQLADAEKALQAQAIAAYTGRADAGRFAGLLLKAANLSQVAAEQSYRRVVAATQADLIISRQRLQERANDLVGELSAAREGAQTERDAVATQTAKIESERNAQAAARRQISIEIANHEELLQEIVDRQDEFEAVAKELEAQSSAIADSLQIRQSSSRSSSGSSSGPKGLGRPLSTINVTSTFGYRVHPIYGDARLHTGIDLGATTGTPIRATGSGTVVSAGWLGGYGNATIIDHGGGLATLYGHQSQILVREGQQVDKGQVIGKVGCTGSCTGPHLHYEVRINGQPVDPKPYL